jgi:glycosyltransferase involved in cell wall biosynthesis
VAVLNVKAPLNTLLGYGHAGWNLARALNAVEPVALFPIGQPHLTTYENELCQQLINKRYELFDKSKPSLTVWHEHDLFDCLHGTPSIGFPFFEINEFCNIRKKSCTVPDKLFVTSKWGKDVIEQNGIKTPTSVVPLGVDSNVFSPRKSTDEVYRFFTVGKIERRKCTDLLPALFDNAFNKTDNVELHVMCDSPLPQIKQQMPYFKQAFANSPLGDKIKIHSLKSTDYELASFMQSMDCGLFLTRAEGWGLPILQSMSCGKPVITTNYSAQTEFANNDNCSLVEIDTLEPAIDNIWFHGQGQWASIGQKQVDQTIEHMRKMYRDNVRTNTEGVNTAQKFSWENAAHALLRGC